MLELERHVPKKTEEKEWYWQAFKGSRKFRYQPIDKPIGKGYFPLAPLYLTDMIRTAEQYSIFISTKIVQQICQYGKLINSKAAKR